MSTTTEESKPPQTVFVIGAGAGVDINMPLGTDLKKKINEAFDIQRDLMGNAKGEKAHFAAVIAKLLSDPKRGFAREQAERARAQFLDGLALSNSIDDFIHQRSDDTAIVALGKLAIVNAILTSEARSRLYPVKRDNKAPAIELDRLSESWYLPFYNFLTKGCNKGTLAGRLSTIKLVIFNYDRCVEHFLFHAIQRHYGVSSDDAAKMLESLEIWHPYGMVGSLPWQKKEMPTEFGEELDGDRLIELSTKILTYTESTKAHPGDLQAMRNVLIQANKIVFLGFAFHEQNLELLLQSAKGGNGANRCTIFGTTAGISDEDAQVIAGSIMQQRDISYRQYDDARLRFAAKGCRELFTKYHHTLLAR